MRRKDREISADEALIVADKCEWAVVSMITPENEPYCVAVTIARIDNSLYFHCAKEGKKVECLRNEPKVCVLCIGDTCIQSDKFTTLYESAIIKGTAHEITEDYEKIEALRAICLRHTPDNMSQFDEAIEHSLSRTAIWRIDIEQITGKAKR